MATRRASLRGDSPRPARVQGVVAAQLFLSLINYGHSPARSGAWSFPRRIGLPRATPDPIRCAPRRRSRRRRRGSRRWERQRIGHRVNDVVAERHDVALVSRLPAESTLRPAPRRKMLSSRPSWIPITPTCGGRAGTSHIRSPHHVEDRELGRVEEFLHFAAAAARRATSAPRRARPPRAPRLRAPPCGYGRRRAPHGSLR